MFFYRGGEPSCLKVQDFEDASSGRWLDKQRIHELGMIFNHYFYYRNALNLCPPWKKCFPFDENKLKRHSNKQPLLFLNWVLNFSQVDR